LILKSADFVNYSGQEIEMKAKIICTAALILMAAACSSRPAKIKKAQEQDPRYQYNLGVFYLNEGQLDRAIFHLNRSLTLQPDNYLGYHSLGLVYSINGEMEKAVEYFQKALSNNPGSTETRNTLGAVYQEMGFLDKAEEEFAAAARDINYKSRELPYYNLARLYAQKDQLDVALEHINTALSFNSSLSIGHNLKGIILERQGLYGAAIDSFRRAVNKTPDDISFTYNLAVAYFKNEEYQQAGGLFEKILPLVTDPESQGRIKDFLEQIAKRRPTVPLRALAAFIRSPRLF
jgi:tetratricopeptide (TPR) repeat protein